MGVRKSTYVPPVAGDDTIEDAELDLDCQKVIEALKRLRSWDKKIEVLQHVIGYFELEKSRKKKL